MKIDLTESFKKIYEVIISQGVGRTEFAKGIGFKSTTQLEKTLTGEATLSTKAIIGLIETYDINPNYLFLGQDDIFINDEDSVDVLKKEINDWKQRHNEVVKTTIELSNEIKKMEKRYYDLVDVTSSAIKFHNQKSNESTNQVDKDSKSE